MTSNLGTEFARKGGALGFMRPGEGATSAEIAADHKKIEEALKREFRPEFLNRVDEIIIFNTLSLEDMERIVDLQMKEVGGRLGEQGLTAELTEAARKWLAKQGYDPQFGARPLRRAIQKHVESPLSVRLLRGEFHSGDCVIVDADHDELTFTRKESAGELVSVPQIESAQA
jgi:ATP-dependent Clp protease ATP-binding subunit ClpC